MADDDDATAVLPSRSDWKALLDEFRALGGRVENVLLRPSATGRGLFPENPERPVLLRVPASLMFRSRDIALCGDCIGIQDSAGTDQRTKDFFERYENTFSWGGGGRAEGAVFIEMFDSLQPELRNRLTAEFGMKPFIEGDRRERTLRHFLRSRAIRRSRESRVAPLLDLIKHGSNGLRTKFGPKGSVQIDGTAEGEIVVANGNDDPLGMFNKQGFAEPRPHAFSLPLRTKAGPSELSIGRDPLTNVERPGFRGPQMRAETGTIHLSYLTVGNAKFPRMPRGMFYTLMQEARAVRAEELFDRILFGNRAKFLALLAALEPDRGELVSRLRAMAHFQLAALAECLGAREL